MYLYALKRIASGKGRRSKAFHAAWQGYARELIAAHKCRNTDRFKVAVALKGNARKILTVIESSVSYALNTAWYRYARKRSTMLKSVIADAFESDSTLECNTFKIAVIKSSHNVRNALGYRYARKLLTALKRRRANALEIAVIVKGYAFKIFAQNKGRFAYAYYGRA